MASPIKHAWTGTSGLSRRTLLKTGLGLAGAVALGACSGGSSQSGASRKTLRVWDAYPKDYPSAKVMQNQVWDKFLAKHPGFHLEYTAGLDPTEIASRFANAVMVNQAPDVFYNYASKGDLWLAGYLQPMESVLSDMGIKDDFYGGALSIWSTEGHLYGVPTWYGTKCYVYRDDCLQKAGIDPSVPRPTTWDGFAQTVGRAAIRDGGRFRQDGYVYYATDDKASSSERLVTHIKQNGGVEFIDDPVRGKSGFREPAAIEAFTWFMDLIRKEKCQDPTGPIAPSEPSEIGKGICAVDYMGPWTIPALADAYPGVLDHLSVGPNLNSGATVGLGNAGAWSVNKKSNVLEESIDLMKILLADDMYTKYNNDAKYPSARKSINDSPDFWMADYPILSTGAFQDSFDNGEDVGNWHVGYSEIYSRAYADLIEKGISSVASDEELMNQAADTIDDITARSLAAIPGAAGHSGS
jgi:ABC-type glycerol-3-phosphate transport system substrate-binding protein